MEKVSKILKKTTPVDKVLVCIPTYNPTGHNHYDVWKMVIDGFVKQRKPDLQVDIVVADNISHPEGRKILRQWQKEVSGLSLVFTEPRYPMHVCINHAWSFFKGYNYFNYTCSDVIPENPDTISILIEDAKKNEDCVVISPQVDCDMCQSFGKHIKDGDFPPTMLKITEAVNGHFYLYDKRYLEAFDYKKVDVLWGHRTETFVSYQCASIGKREYISHRVKLHHYREGAKNIGVERKDFASYDKPYETYGDKQKFMDVMTEGIKIGLGFEELYHLAGHPVPECRLHNPDAFDEQKLAKTDELYRFIKANLFLTKKQLDYDKIEYEYYPAET